MSVGGGGYAGTLSAGGCSSYPGWSGWQQLSDGHWYDYYEWDCYLNGETAYAVRYYWEWNGYASVYIGWLYHYNDGSQSALHN